VDLKALADATDGLVGADIEAICRRASMLAIREFLGKHRTFKSETKKVELSQARVSNKHFEEVIRELRKK